MLKYFVLFTILLAFISCQQLPKEDNYIGKRFQLTDHNGKQVTFPNCVKGKTTVLGYVFTNCPDICPLTTNNMRLIQDKVKEENLTNVQFLTISFDPVVDTPEILRKYIKVRDLDDSNWKFLTGEKPLIDSLIQSINFLAVVGDSTVFEDGSKTFYYVHTDLVQLMDEEGYIRGNYPGSSLNIDEIMNDLRKLTN